MGAWYPIGIASGIGVAIGLLLAGIAAPRRPAGLAVVLAASAGAALAVGYVLEDWGALTGVVGYLEGALLPVLGARLRRRSGSTYAGLRILARD